MQVPTIAELSAALREVSGEVDGECDVRLCIDPTGWVLRWGSSDYDQRHSLVCAASCVPGCLDGRYQAFDSRRIAWELVEDCEDQIAQLEETDY